MQLYQYDEKRVEGMAEFIKADIFYHISAKDSKGGRVKVRRNGKTKIWKRTPSYYEIPVKHGLKKCFRITPYTAHEWTIT